MDRDQKPIAQFVERRFKMILAMVNSKVFDASDMLAECALLMGYIVKNTEKMDHKLWTNYMIALVGVIEIVDPEKQQVDALKGKNTNEERLT